MIHCFEKRLRRLAPGWGVSVLRPSGEVVCRGECLVAPRRAEAKALSACFHFHDVLCFRFPWLVDSKQWNRFTGSVLLFSKLWSFLLLVIPYHLPFYWQTSFALCNSPLESFYFFFDFLFFIFYLLLYSSFHCYSIGFLLSFVLGYTFFLFFPLFFFFFFSYWTLYSL